MRNRRFNSRTKRQTRKENYIFSTIIILMGIYLITTNGNQSAMQICQQKMSYDQCFWDISR